MYINRPRSKDRAYNSETSRQKLEITQAFSIADRDSDRSEQPQR